MSDPEAAREAWREFERVARADAYAELDVLEQTPLVFGQHIAWTIGMQGRTCGLSPIHRVGFPIGSRPYTTCHEVIPGPACWMPLGPGLLRTMGQCQFCEAEMARISRAKSYDAA